MIREGDVSQLFKNSHLCLHFLHVAHFVIFSRFLFVLFSFLYSDGYALRRNSAPFAETIIMSVVFFKFLFSGLLRHDIIVVVDWALETTADGSLCLS